MAGAVVHVVMWILILLLLVAAGWLGVGGAMAIGVPPWVGGIVGVFTLGPVLLGVLGKLALVVAEQLEKR